MLPAKTRSYALAPAHPKRPNVMRFLPYIKPFAPQFITSFALAPIQVLASVSIPLLLGAVVDGPIREGDVTGVVLFALALLGVGAAEALVSLIRRWIMSRAT